MRSKWEEHEDQYLHANAGSMEHQAMGAVLGRTRNAVRNRCHRLGLVDTSDNWTDDQVKSLMIAYSNACSNESLDLPAIAASLGKLKSNVSRKARELGLTNIARKGYDKGKESTNPSRIKSSMRQKAWIQENGHPRGALGMRHTPETRQKMSDASIKAASLRTEEQKTAIALKAMKTKEKNGTMHLPRIGTTWKSGWREIGGIRKYYRSKWEANYAWYLQWLKEKGQIEDWKHEPKTFWFEGVKRGTVSYLPDFWVLELNGTDSFHEVKGWMDDRSKTKIKRMAKYYPNVKLVVIDSKGYAALAKSVSSLVPGWEP